MIPAVNQVSDRPPGPPPATGTGPSKGQGGSPKASLGPPPSESAAEAVIAYLAHAGVLEGRGPGKAVHKALRQDFPKKAIRWVKHADWRGPVTVATSRIDTSNKANWAASDHPAHVDDFRADARNGTLKPITLVKRPGIRKLLIPDGHHRLLAAMAEGKPVRAYIATVGTVHGPWDDMHASQRDGNSGTRETVAEHTAKLTARQRAYNQLARNHPASALAWVNDPGTTWSGPHNVGTSLLDFDDKSEWDAEGDRAKVARIKKRIRKTGTMKPAILVRAPGHEKDIIADGHHHVLAAIAAGVPVRAYVAHVRSAKGPWMTLSTRQRRETAEAADRPRISKADAVYQPAAEQAVRCQTCVMFHDDRCDLVQGDIDPDAVCLHWEAKPSADTAARAGRPDVARRL
jgi:hypothetical protein